MLAQVVRFRSCPWLLWPDRMMTLRLLHCGVRCGLKALPVKPQPYVCTRPKSYLCSSMVHAPNLSINNGLSLVPIGMYVICEQGG